MFKAIYIHTQPLKHTKNMQRLTSYIKKQDFSKKTSFVTKKTSFFKKNNQAFQKKQEFGGTRLKFGYIDCKKGYIIDKNSIKLIGTK